MKDIKQVLQEYCAECKHKRYPDCKLACQHPDKNLCMALAYVAEGHLLAMQDIYKELPTLKNPAKLTTSDIELILNIEAEVQKEHPLPYLEMKGWYLNEILNRFNKQKGV